MSTLATVRVACPTCGASIEGEIGVFVRLDRRVDLRDAVLARRFNVLAGACGHDVEIIRTVGVVDFANARFVSCYPAWAEVHWADLAAATRTLFRRNFDGKAASVLGRRDWAVRVVFGYEALREKLVIWDAGLDEVRVEAAKSRLLAGRPEALGTLLLVDRVDPDAIAFRAFAPDGGVATWSTPPEVLDREPPPGLLPETLLTDPFVSARRWFVDPTGADPLTFDVDGTGVWPAHVEPRRRYDDTSG